MKKGICTMKKIITASFVAMLILFLAACGDSNTDSSKDSGDQDIEVITITHELDETTVEKNPEKVVVFDFGALDTLDALSIDVTAVPRGGVIPSYLEKYDSDDYENVGSLKEPDFDKIAEIDPDLILISARQADLYDELSKLGPTVYVGVDTTRYMDSFKENVHTIAEIFDKEDEVDKTLEEIDQSIEDLHAKAQDSGKNGLIVLANDDKISAYGPSSRFGLVHDVFGVEPVDEDIEASTHGKNVSFEYVTEMNPDILYVIDRTAAIGNESNVQEMIENKLVEKTDAYQNDDIYYLHADNWYLSGGGLISVQNMINEIEESLAE